MSGARHLAQLNIASLRQPLDDPRTADFVDGLATVNAAGEQSAGYVWRLQSDSGDATDIRVFDDPSIIVNLTVWQSIDDLKAFAFRGTHRDFLRRRGEWFVEGASRTALWWLPATDLPTTDDAKRRLDFIDAFGPAPYAFQMGQAHPALVIRPDGQANATSVAMVAEIDDVPAAFGSYRIVDSSTAWIDRIDVPQAARGMRVGAAIVAELESAARAAQLQRIQLHTLPKQLKPYERFGFHERVCDHDDAEWRSVCLEKTLGSEPGRLA